MEKGNGVCCGGECSPGDQSADAGEVEDVGGSRVEGPDPPGRAICGLREV